MTQRFAACLPLGALALLPLFGTAAPTAAPRPAATPSKPCGFVSFVPVGWRRSPGGGAEETIKAMVTYPDGHQESAVFPYPWIYPNAEETDPWSNTNLSRGAFAITLQRPPPGTDMAKLPPLIEYVLRHTDAAGYTDLAECPRTPSGKAPVASAQPLPATTPR